jgi:lipopolysaccharide biosynthesis glycosyltransferase
MKVCFGVICIGKSYLEEFERLFKPSVLEYCQRFGYDLKIFTDFLDPKQRHPHTISFQKCLVPSFLKEYDLVIILDADIYIHSQATPIHSLDIGDKIGIVDEVYQSTPENYKKLTESGFTDSAESYYQKSGFTLQTDKILNTGVILCKPSIHADYLRTIYETYVDTSIGHPREFHYEQSCIGYVLQKDSQYILIPNCWNHIYLHSQITRVPIINQYFVHFAGLRGSYREIALSGHTRKNFPRWGIKK